MQQHSEHQARPLARTIGVLESIERTVFVFIGILLFCAAIVLLARSGGYLLLMANPANDNPLATGAAFLDQVLLVLMIVELAYTVMLSLRGRVLAPEPFLIVGLIAVIRRILVITVNEAQHGGASAVSPAILAELQVLTGITAVFVLSIAVMRLVSQRGRARETSAADL